MDPVGLYAECSTMATIVILCVYFLTAAAAVIAWLYVDRHPRAGAGEGAEA